MKVRESRMKESHMKESRMKESRIMVLSLTYDRAAGVRFAKPLAHR